jgi:uncharacterized protein (TIGR02271 family)
MTDLRRASSEQTLALAEEVLKVGKRQVVTGRVRVRTETETVETMARAELEGETVEVTRVPCERYVDEAPPVRTEGEVTILPVVEEVLVVETRLLLKEEIHLRRTKTRETVEIPATLRRQRAVVERIDPVTGDVTIDPHHPISKD